jgi:hypothetical protein
MTKAEKKRGLSSDNLKLIALAAMTLFHAADILFPWWKQFVPDAEAALLLVFCMAIGMTAMPIICFLAAEGALYTKNWKRYWLRLSLWAIPSYIAFALAAGKPLNPFAPPLFMHTSVLWTISCGIGAVFMLKRRKFWVMPLLLVIGLYGDWGLSAPAAILCMALTHGDFRKQMLLMILCFSLSLLYTQQPALILIQSCFMAAIPVLRQYNGKLNNAGTKPLPRSFFYWYYPAHLFLLAGIRWVLI